MFDDNEKCEKSDSKAILEVIRVIFYPLKKIAIVQKFFYAPAKRKKEQKLTCYVVAASSNLLFLERKDIWNDLIL